MYREICFVFVTTIILMLIRKKSVEEFKNENINLLEKCFPRDKLDLDLDKEHYKYSEVVKTENGILYCTPNNRVPGIPQLTWNGVFLNNLCIDPKKRNKGEATKLIKKVIDKAKKRGNDHIILQVENSNTPAVNLYKKLGFKKHMEGINEDGQLASVYVRYL
jgi:ribosomal protein S18 acetylase RimI-like enzyme